MDNILNNDEQKIIFLKAILLGINYGQSDNVKYYINNIENEITKWKSILQTPMDSSKLTSDKSPSPSPSLSPDIIKIENIILMLENQKKNTITYIQKLSSNNYGSNYSRINILKNNLTLLNQEILKNKEKINNINNKLLNKEFIRIPTQTSPQTLNNISNQERDKKVRWENKSNINIVGLDSRRANAMKDLNGALETKPNIIKKDIFSDRIVKKPSQGSWMDNIGKNNPIENHKIQPSIGGMRNHEARFEGFQKSTSKSQLVGELEQTLGNLSNMIIS